MNISNLQRLNSNFNTLFSIVKEGFHSMTAKIDHDRTTIRELERLLTIHRIPFQQQEEDNEIDRRIELINQKIVDFMTQKTAVGCANKRKKRAQKTDRFFEMEQEVSDFSRSVKRGEAVPK